MVPALPAEVDWRIPLKAACLGVTKRPPDPSMGCVPFDKELYVNLASASSA